MVYLWSWLWIQLVKQVYSVTLLLWRKLGLGFQKNLGYLLYKGGSYFYLFLYFPQHTVWDTLLQMQQMSVELNENDKGLLIKKKKLRTNIYWSFIMSQAWCAMCRYLSHCLNSSLQYPHRTCIYLFILIYKWKISCKVKYHIQDHTARAVSLKYLQISAQRNRSETYISNLSFLHHQRLERRIQQDLCRKEMITYQLNGKLQSHHLPSLCLRDFWAASIGQGFPGWRAWHWSSRASHGGVGNAYWSPALVASAFGTEIDFLHFRVTAHLSFWLRSNVVLVLYQIQPQPWD